MPKSIKIILVFIWLFSVITLVRAENILFEEFVNHDITVPPETEQLKREVNIRNGHAYVDYTYRSRLSRNEILAYYRPIFLDEGFKEEKDALENADKQPSYYKFNRGAIGFRMVMFLGSDAEDKNKIIYGITLMENYDIMALSALKFKKPQQYKDLPVPYGVWQGMSNTKNTPYICYLTKGEVEEVVEFYLKNMEENSWTLVENKPYEGKYNFIYAFGKDDEASQAYTQAGINPEDFYPGVEINVKGVNLKYENKKEYCFLQIVQFLDSAEALKMMRIDPDLFIKYGNIYINIVRMDKKEFAQLNEKRKLSMEKNKNELRNFLGY